MVVGHSAAGKSMTARVLGMDRQKSDFDCFVRGRKGTSEELVDRFLAAGSSFFIAPNTPEILHILAEKRYRAAADTAIVYLRRPKEVIGQNITRVNEDGQAHKAIPDFDKYYAHYDALYRGAADYIFNCDGPLEEAAFALHAFAGELTKRTPSRLMDAVEKINLFPEYLSALQDSRRPDREPVLLNPAEMKRLTAGGYQVFETGVYPPVPVTASICQMKLADLRWSVQDFSGMTVAEIGSQLGFFSFIAESLGASEIVGMDTNPQFVAEANKFAVHYKRICEWPDDRIMFRTQMMRVGEPLAVRPDIIIASSIIHWFIIQNRGISIEDVLCWLRDNCNHALYFEGCVTASEKIMKDNGIPLERYDEGRFLKACSSVFGRCEVVGRCSYNEQRLVARLYK
jgi:hypothetical protein